MNRPLVIRPWHRTVFFLAALFPSALFAAQTVLNFDDVSAPGPGVVSIPAGYGGVNWAVNMGIWGFDQSPYLPQSPPNRVLFNRNFESGVAESLVSFINGPKIFDGAYFSGQDNVQLNLYSGQTLVATSGVLSLGTGSGPFFLQSGYAGPVDMVGIVGTRGAFAMDNFTFETVPEPSTFVLAALGAVAVLAACRRLS